MNTQMMNQIGEVVQEFSASVDGGFCEQVDSEDPNSKHPYLRLQYLLENRIFPAKAGGIYSDGVVSVDVRVATDTNVIEDVDFQVSFFDNDTEEHIDFASSKMVCKEHFKFDTNDIMDGFEEFKERVEKIQKVLDI